MVGRNDKCPCGSGKKYKKCCESKEAVSVAEVTSEELERVLQSFYDEYPERKDIREYLNLANEWKQNLQQNFSEEMIEAIVLDEFFFHHREDIWQGYLEKQKKKLIRPVVLKVIDQWTSPQAIIGEVLGVDEEYLTVKIILTDEVIQLRREVDKPVPVGVHLYCFILPDGTENENHFLAVSSLIFFPIDHQQVFTEFIKLFEKTDGQTTEQFMKEQGMSFWKMLANDNYDGSEFTNFEAGVLQSIMAFLDKHEQESDKLLEIVEDFLVEQQPNARKEVAIAAGAIRFGQEKGLFDSIQMTVKEIAESFEVSPSSMNKYYKDLLAYEEQKIGVE
ncbi:SEC-C domain-containing protein [Sporosarcina saromensis]|uniref:SEC-C domain-containing protein n=1 Tax=Sporosarcina saromensis TaxID=359365 RepID=A0ABU4GEB7_9BACL|nr:SEC-C domain-containing protein [Sporosarcina saromensis]MDW0114722.1 SEC-C domain-containing protein [Sporosarcina saromensis]